MNYDSLIMLNNCIKSELPLDIIEIINENVIINKVRGTQNGTIDYACKTNNFKLLKLYKKYNLPYTEQSLIYACYHGNLNMVIYIDNNFVFDKNKTCFAEIASKKGHFNIIKWLHYNNYKFSILTLFNSEINHYIDVLNYICKNIKNIDCNIIDLKIAVNVGNFKIIDYIFNKIFDENIDFIKYSLTYGYTKSIIMINDLINYYETIN